MDKLPTTVDFQGTVFDEVTPLKGTAEDYFKKHKITSITDLSDYQNCESLNPTIAYIIRFNNHQCAISNDEILLLGKNKAISNLLYSLLGVNGNMGDSVGDGDDKEGYHKLYYGRLKTIKHIGLLDLANGHTVTIENY